MNSITTSFLATALCTALAAQTTTIPVTTIADNLANPPTGSLRAAVLAANQARGSATAPITIAFSAGLVGQTITLVSQLPFLTANNVTFQVPVANNSQRITIDANVRNGAMLILGNDVTVRHIRMRGGLLDTLSLYGASRTTFEFCDLQATGEGACYSIGSPDTVFRDCLFDGGTGLGLLVVDGGDRLRVERCTFRNYTTSAGLTCTGVSGFVMTDTTITNCANGLQLIEVCRNAVVGPGNQLIGNLVQGLVSTLSLNLRVTGTTIRNNGGWGAYIQDACVDTVIEDSLFDQNGVGSPLIAQGASQLVLSDDVRTTIRRTNFTAGYGIAIETLHSTGLRIPALAPFCQVTGHRGNGIKLANQTSDVRIEQVLVQGNSTTLAEPQVLMLDSSGVLLTGCTITASARGGLQTVRCNAITVTGATQITNHGSSPITITESSDVVIGPRNVADPVEKGCVLSGNTGGIAFDRATNCRMQGNTTLPGGACTVSGATSPITVGTNCASVSIGPAVTLTQTAGAGIVVTAGANLTKIDGCTISGHTGDAIFLSNATNTEIRSCVLTGNGSSGSGVLVDRANGTSILGCTIWLHAAQGVVIQDSTNVLVGPGNMVKRNSREGVLVQQGGSALPTAVTFESTAIVNNGFGGPSYAGLFARNSTIKVVNCTIASSLNPGHNWNLFVASTATATVSNTILWGANFADRFLQSGTSFMDYSIYSTQTSSAAWSSHSAGSNVTTNPLLTNVAAEDVHIAATSPAKHTGTNAPTNIALPSVDFEGDPRVICTTVDRGADERVLPCVLGNSLHLAGEWLREPTAALLRLDLESSARAGQTALLLASFAGAKNGTPLNAGAVLPLQLDELSAAFLATPELALAQLDAQGRASVTLAVPTVVLDAFGRQLSFAFTTLPALDFASNPVVVRFFQ